MPTNIAITEHVVQELPSERPLVTGEKYKVMQPDGTLIEYTIDSQGEPVRVKGITNDESSRLDRLTTEEISKVESITTGDISKLKEDYTRAEVDQKFEDVRNLANSSRINLNGSTVLPVPPTRPDSSVIEDAWVRLAQNVTYTQSGGDPLTGIEGHETIAEWDNEEGEWSLVDMGELPDGGTKSPDWVAGAYLEGDVRYHNNMTWRAMIDTTDEPTIGSDWETLTPLSDFIEEGGTAGLTQRGAYSSLSKVIGFPTFVPFILLPGMIGTSGEETNTSVNWIRTDRIPYDSELGGGIRLEGLGRSTTPNNENTLNSRRMAFYNSDGDFIGIREGVDGSSTMTIEPIEGTAEYIVQVDSVPGVGEDIPNSPFWTTLKISQTPSDTGTYLKGETIVGRIDTPQLRGIEASLETVTLSGKGAPSSSVGSEGSLYLDLQFGLVYEKKNGLWGNPQPIGGQFRKFTIPTEFGQVPGIEINKNSANGVYVPYVTDVYSFVSDKIQEMTPYYVDPLNGESDNDGLSEGTAVSAVNEAISLGAQLIYCLPGDYNRSQGVLANTVVTSNLAVIAPRGGVNMSSWDNGDSFTWVLEDGVYRTERSGTEQVYDTTSTDDYGYFPYSKKSTLNECKAEPGSFFLQGTTVYVNTLDSLIPDLRIKLNLKVVTCQIRLGADIDFVYMEGITSYSSNNQGNFIFENDTTTQYDGKVYVKNCTGILNRSANGFKYTNVKEVWSQNCGATKCATDALNYHTTIPEYERMLAIELNCWSNDTGFETPGESSSNGSTAHDGMRIIRFGGNFDIARGSTVVDVNPGIRSLNFNVNSGGSYLATTAAFHVQNGIMWLYNCYGHTSTLAAKADGVTEPPTLYYDSDTLLDGDTQGNVIPI